MSIRQKFVEAFSEEQAQRIEHAAIQHKNGVHDKTGSDPFKWALCICIGFGCLKKPSYRDEHKITIPYEQLRDWIRDHAELATHDGDVDFIAAFCGVYDEFLPAEGKEK